MSLDKVTVTNQGLLNINRKIINDRKFADNLISNIGDVSVDSNTASEFSSESYLQKSGLSFSGEPISIIFEGSFISSVEGMPETAWTLSGSNGSLRFCIVHETIEDANSTQEINYPQLVLPSGSTISFSDKLNFNDGSNFKAYVDIYPESCRVLIEYKNEIFSQPPITFSSPLDLTSFSIFTLGNDPSNLVQFWEGSINLKNVEIRQNQESFFTPTTGYSLEFTQIAINDGKYSLSSNPTSIARHRYLYPITQKTRSDNTLLLTSVLSDSTKLVIREIGLYAVVKNGDYEEEFLFGYIQNLNIDKGSDVPYDLILTVDLAINTVNVVGFPDANSFILNVAKPALLKNFITARNTNTYVIENLERIIKMNSFQPSKEIGSCYNPETGEDELVPFKPSQIESIGYNTPQLVYRTQKTITEQEDCYSSVQTYSKLFKKLQRITYQQFDMNSITPMGDIEVTSEGVATNFSLTNYIEPSNNLNTDDWTFTIAFSVGTSSNSRCLISMGDLEGNYADEDEGIPATDFSYTPFSNIRINRDNKLVINGTTNAYTLQSNQKYFLKLIYTSAGSNLQVRISADGKSYEPVSVANVPSYNQLNIISLGILGEYAVAADYKSATFQSSYPLTDGTVYLFDSGFEQYNNDWITTEEIVEQPAQLLQYYHLPTYNVDSYRTYDICNNPDYYIDFLDDSYTGNSDLIDFSENLTLCLKLDLQELNKWLNNYSEESPEYALVISKVRGSLDLFKLIIKHNKDINDNISYNLSFVLSTTSSNNILLGVENIQPADFAKLLKAPFLLTIVRDNNSLYMYRNNILIASTSGISSLPSYANSYLINTLEGYATGKYVKDIITIKEAISSEQLYYITNLTDTNF